MDKIIKRKLMFLLPISFGLLAGWGLFFKLNRQQDSTLVLNNFILPQTVSYFEINLDSSQFKDLFTKHFLVKRDLYHFLQFQGIPLNAWQPEYGIKKIAKLRVKLAVKQYVNVWLFYTSDNVHNLEALGLKNYYTIFLSRHILAVTKNQIIADKLRLGPAYKNINYLSNYSSAILYGYVDFNDYLSTFKQDLPIEEQRLFDKYLSQAGNFIWSANYNSSGMNLDLNFQLGIKSGLLNGFKTARQEAISRLNKEKFLSLSPVVMVNNFNTQDILFILDDYLKTTLTNRMDFFKSLLWKKYKIKLNNLYTLFEQPISIVIRPKNSGCGLLNLIAKSNYEYALFWRYDPLIKNKNIFINDIKQTLQNYLAFKFPIRKKKVLPDGTSGFELAADPQAFHWRQIVINGWIIHFLNFNNKQIVYAQGDKKFVLANSKNLLLDILKAHKTAPLVDSYYNFYINPASLISKDLSAWQSIYLGGDFKDGFLRGRAKLTL